MTISPAQLRLFLVLLVLAVASGFIYLANVEAAQTSAYYGAITRSMSMNFSNWLFGSVDPAGSVSLDKIPGSFWIPAIFVKLFGFHTFSIVAPNGLATIGAVLAIALAGRRIAKFAGSTDALADLIALLSGLFIATTPIISAVARSNEPESYFLLFFSLAFHRAVVAIQTGKRSQLIFAGLWVAMAFQCYMIEAWVVWPAMIAAWFALSNKKLLTKFIDLAIAGSISVFASLLWIIAVTVTPASARPYVGGTYKNSAWEMVFGYNALGRLSATDKTHAFRSFTPHFSGNAGWLRLFNIQVAGQIGWLIIPAFVAVLILVLVLGFDSMLIFGGSALVLFYLEYSFVAGMHQYYTAALALPIALVFAYLFAKGKPWMFMLVALVSVAVAFGITHYYPGYFTVMPYIAFAMIGVLVLLYGTLPKHHGLLAVALAASLMMAPAAWSVDAINHTSGTNPVAGPRIPAALTGTVVKKPHAPVRTYAQDVHGARMIRDYIKANVVGHPKYRLATFSAALASPIINITGMSVLPIGGFNGFDPVPTYAKFKELVNTRELQYVIYGETYASITTHGNTAKIARRVVATCKPVMGTIYGELYHCPPSK